MGAEQSSQSSEEFLRNFSSRYSFVKEINDLKFGEIHIYKENTSQKYVFVKGIWCDSEETYHQQLRECSRRQGLNHRNLVKMIGFHQQSEAQVCGDFSKITTYFEYFQHTLEREIQQRQQISNHFSEQEIWFLLESLVSVGAYLETQKISHGDIRPLNILMAQDGQVKVADQMFINNNKTGYIKALQGEQVYFSPSLISAFSRRETNPQHNAFKTDVFTTALSVLEGCTLESSLDCFDTAQGLINRQLVNNLLQQARQFYSQFLVNLLNEMLSEDEYTRPSFNELQAMLQPYQARIRNMEPFLTEQPVTQVFLPPQQSQIAQSIIIQPQQPQYIQQPTNLNATRFSPKVPKQVVQYQEIPQEFTYSQQQQPFQYQTQQTSYQPIQPPQFQQQSVYQQPPQYQNTNLQYTQRIQPPNQIITQQQPIYQPQTQSQFIQPFNTAQSIVIQQQPPQQYISQAQFQSPIRNDYSQQVPSYDPYVRPLQFSPQNFNQYPQNHSVYQTGDIDRRVQEALKTSEETILRHSQQPPQQRNQIQYRQF